MTRKPGPVPPMMAVLALVKKRDRYAVNLSLHGPLAG
jgi:hypothetical protein